MINAFRKMYVLPFKYKIPHYTSQYLETTSVLKRFSKFFRRHLYMAINSHLVLEQNKIQDKQKNILWINLSAPSMGDSLMDLSSRVFLKDKSIDLFTDIKNAHIYKSDKIFKNIITNALLIDKSKYDLVIIDSYGTRGLRTKFKYLSDLPFVGMYGYYNGPEVNRVLYSFHRMNQLLGYVKSKDEINNSAKAIIYISSKDEELVDNIKLPENFITIAIGGEWDYRTYNNWDKIISKIIVNDPKTNIILIGSDNAKNQEQQILQQFKAYNIASVVAKYSFMQTAQIIKKSDVLICCDGGLMHLANSVNTTIIPLFAHLTSQMQLTNVIKAYPVYDKTNVNNITVDDIVKKYKQYLGER